MTVIERFGVKGQKDYQPVGALRLDERRFELRDYFGRLWRHRRLLFGTIVLLNALAAIVVFQVTPLFRGEVLVMVAPPQSNVVKVEAVLSGLPFNESTINSEITVLKSRKLASRVVDRLKLTEDPEFNRALNPSRSFTEWLMSVLGTKTEEKLTSDQKKSRERQSVIERFRSAMKAEPVSQSRVIRIRFTANEAAKAANIANKIADLYLVEQLEAKFEATERASKWLSERIIHLRAAVERSEQAVEAYRREHGLIKGSDDLTTAAGQISALSTQLVNARAKRAEVEARLSQIERLLKSRRGIESASDVLSSPLIQRLGERESTLIGRIAELRAEYGPKHPKMIAARAEIADLRRKIQEEVKKIVQRVRSEAIVVRARVKSLERSMRNLESRVANLNQKSVRLRTLEREARANRTFLETVLKRFKETSAQEGLQTPDARIISAAVIPLRSYYPNIPLLLGLVFVGSLIIGLGLVVLRDHLDSGFRSAEQVENFAGIAALGLVPEISSRSIGKSGIKGFIADNPLSAYVEALRNLQVNLALSDVDQPVKTIVITSSSPEEGKSTLAYSFASAAAQFGKKTVLVDCDIRRPVQHSLAEINREPGLVDYLAHKKSLDKVLKKDLATGLSIIPAGESAPTPPDLLASQQMQQLIEKLSKDFDLVVFDSPPVMAVSDARILSRQVDRVLFAVRWAKTRRENAIYSIKQLTESGARVAGVALTRVDIKKHSEYRFADSGYYHRKYAKYYNS